MFEEKIKSDFININEHITNYGIFEEELLNAQFSLSSELLVEDCGHIEEFTCIFCSYIVDSPIQCQKCEKIYCENCIKKYTSLQKNKCPHCREAPFKSQKLPRMARMLLENLNFKCPFNCGESFEYSNFQRHLSTCNNIKIYKCNLCKAELPWNPAMKDVHKPECQKLKITCPYCKNQLIKFNYKSHIETCPKSFIHCQECKLNIPPHFQDAHKSFFCAEIKRLLDSVSSLIHQLQQL